MDCATLTCPVRSRDRLGGGAWACRAMSHVRCGGVRVRPKVNSHSKSEDAEINDAACILKSTHRPTCLPLVPANRSAPARSSKYNAPPAAPAARVHVCISGPFAQPPASMVTILAAIDIYISRSAWDYAARGVRVSLRGARARSACDDLACGGAAFFDVMTPISRDLVRLQE